MKNLLRAAAITVASTALVAGGATVATAAPGTAAAPVSTVASAGGVSAAAAPYAPDGKSRIKVTKRGSKLKFNLLARYRDDAGQAVGIRKATIQVLKGRKWKTLKNVKLNSSGRGTYKKSDGKKRKYRMLVKPTATYQGFRTFSVRI